MKKAKEIHGGVGPLDDLRVLEIGDEQGEYCGLSLYGLGAEVIRIEPPSGASSRMNHPFYQDEPNPERSLYFWAYNRGKKSIVLDLDKPEDQKTFLQLAKTSDVILDSTPRGYLAERGLDMKSLRAEDPRLIHARITAFGDDGPWKDWKSSDLVHLALGGAVMNCGYDPNPDMDYDLPPVAPQAGHAFAVAGEQMAFSILAAVLHRDETGNGQDLSCSIHEANAKNTEADLMSWVLLRTPFMRQTARHSANVYSKYRTIVQTSDGRWILAHTRNAEPLRRFLEPYGLTGEVHDADPSDVGNQQLPGTEKGASSNMVTIEQLVRRWRYQDVPWEKAQEAGLMWVPVRKPHENVEDEHWQIRGSFQEVEHPEEGRSFTYPTSKWISTAAGWRKGRRAPLLDEHRKELLEQQTAARPLPARAKNAPSVGGDFRSIHGKPMPLAGVRVLDFTWMLASAGATRFLASLGADVIKVEWKSNIDPRRGGRPVGGRAARELATEPVPSEWPADLGGPVGGQYNNKNPGKRGISLNVRDPRGLEIARQLVGTADIVAEGFSPGVMERWGLGYDVLKSIKPDIIYGKQSGLGTLGRYGRFRTVGPVAQAISGLTEMSGLPEPYPPAGWGYSYLDWFGAYSFALALLTALYHRQRTGEGQAIDASQVEVGLFLTSVPVLDWSANGRVWQRSGNRSPYMLSAPEGIYPCAGTDRWIAISCRTEACWHALTEVLARPAWRNDSRFHGFEQRLAHRRELDLLISEATRTQNGRELMLQLQAAGVAAGVAQTAEDRADWDPQLRHLNWLTEVDADQLGRWPVAEASVRFSETPTHAGGRIDRGAPTYGEHNHEVYSQLLGFSEKDLARLAAEDVI